MGLAKLMRDCLERWIAFLSMTPEVVVRSSHVCAQMCTYTYTHKYPHIYVHFYIHEHTYADVFTY